MEAGDRYMIIFLLLCKNRANGEMYDGAHFWYFQVKFFKLLPGTSVHYQMS